MRTLRWASMAAACAITLAACAQKATEGSGDGPGDPRPTEASSRPTPLVPLDDILSGGPPPDGIPPIDDPRFVAPAGAEFLADAEPVLAVEIDGDARAYPLQIMTWHEIVNDEIGGVPVSVTYCPLCNTGIAFVRPTIDGQLLDFGTSGKLYNSNLVMYDRPDRVVLGPGDRAGHPGRARRGTARLRAGADPVVRGLAGRAA